MLNFFKNIFFKDIANQDFKPGSNKYFIEKYKEFDEVIKTYYQAKDHNGKIITIDGLVVPLKIDNRQTFSVIDDQGQTPHCGAFSIAGIIEALIWKRTGKLINLDANQIYAKAKTIDGNINKDGTSLEAAIKAALQLGGLGEYSKNIKLGFVYNDGTDNMQFIIKRLLHKYEFLHAGFAITDGWYRCNNYNYKISHGRINYGGHAVVIVGADTEGVYIANSWGKNWGAKGFAIMPWNVFKQEFMYACFLQNCFDNWKE